MQCTMKEYLHEVGLDAYMYLYSVTPAMREAAGIRARVAPLFTTLRTLKTPTKLAKTPRHQGIFCERPPCNMA
jgi:hypothetical protein